MSRLLVSAEQMNSNYISTDTLPFIDEVLRYYMKWGDGNEKMRVNYIKGNYCRDRGDSPMALHYYIEATKQADTANINCDFKRLSRVYGQIAEIYNKQRFPANELKAWENAFRFAWKANDTIAYISFRGRMAGTCHLMNEREKYAELVKWEYSEYKRHGFHDLAAASKSALLDYYLCKDSLVEAKQAIDEYKACSGLVGSNGEITPGYEAFYYFMGLYYEKVHCPDSALLYYRKLISFPDEIQNLENGYKGLMNIYLQLGQLDSVSKFAQLYANANDTANLRHSAEEVSRVQALYDYSDYQRKSAEKAKEAENLWKLILGVIILNVFLGCVIYAYVRKQREIMNARVKEYVDVVGKYACAEHEISLLKENHEAFEREKLQEIGRLKERISFLQSEINPSEWEQEQMLKNHILISQFRSYVNNGGQFQPTVKEWYDLNALTCKHLPRFYNFLNHTKLDTLEIRLCILTCLAFTPKDISVLMGMSKQSITNMRGMLNKRIFNTEGAKTFSSNIMLFENKKSISRN